MSPATDKDMATRHVELLTGDPNTSVCIRLIHDKDKDRSARKLKGKLSELWPDIVTAQNKGYGAFVVVNEGGDTNAQIAHIRACFVDADNVPLPIAWHLQPDFIVQRDETHWHAYWRVLDIPVDRFRDIQRRLAAHYGTDPAVCNQSRVMRLAGSIHQKFEPVGTQFFDMSDGQPSCLLGHQEDEIICGLPEIAPVQNPKQSNNCGDPVDAELLREAASYLEPDTSYDEWRDNVAAIGTANCTQAHQIAHEYSEGKLDRRKRYRDYRPSRYSGREAIDTVLKTMPRKSGGIGVGTIDKKARDAGWKGTLAPRPTAQDTFSHIASSAKNDVTPNPFSTREQDETAPPPDWLVDELLQENTDALIVAPSKHLKSFAAVDIACSIATGTPVFDTLAVKRKATSFYAAGEGASDLKKHRFTAWETAHGMPPYSADGVHVSDSVPTLSTHSLDEFIEGARAHMQPGERAGLFVIDTMNRALNGADEDKSSTASVYFNMLAKIRQHLECTTLTIHHMGKNSEKGARGSSAFYAGFDTVLVIDKAVKDKETGDYFISLHVDKQKSGEDGQVFNLRSQRVSTQDGTSLVLRPITDDEARRAAGKQIGLRRSEVGAALREFGAAPGGTNAWDGKRGGTTTRNLAELIARRRAATDARGVTDKEINVLVAALNKGARDGGTLGAYVVDTSMGRQWAIVDGVLEREVPHA